MLAAIVFLGADNKIRLKVSDNSTDPATPINWLAVGTSKMELYISGLTVTSSTSRLNYFDGGIIELTLGDVPGLVIKREYAISIKAWDPLHPNGQVIVHPDMANSAFTVNVVESEVYY